jgi:ATP-dependent Lon protease
VLREFALPTGAVRIADDVMRSIIELVEEEHGVRNLRRAIHDIVSHFNYDRLTTACDCPDIRMITREDADRSIRSGRRDGPGSISKASYMSMYC